MPRLSLGFDEGEINFYACSVRFIEAADPVRLEGDVMSRTGTRSWHAPARATANLACDAC